MHPYIEAFLIKGSLFKKSLAKKWASTHGVKLKVQTQASYGFMEYKYTT